MFHRAKTLAAAIAATTMLTSAAFAGELVINTDTSDPAPKAAFAEMDARLKQTAGRLARDIDPDDLRTTVKVLNELRTKLDEA